MAITFFHAQETFYNLKPVKAAKIANLNKLSALQCVHGLENQATFKNHQIKECRETGKCSRDNDIGEHT